MLIITEDDVRKVLPMSVCIDAMHTAFTELGNGIAGYFPRARYKVPPDVNELGYMTNIIAGAVPSFGVAALRHNSMIVEEHIVSGKMRWESTHETNRSWGFVILFSLKTGEPLAYIHDLAISAMRVGATTGVAVRAFAKNGASSVGMFGSGYQAVRNLEAICCVRKIERVRIYSPNKAHRQAFAQDMTKLLGVEVSPATSPEAAVKGMDIVMCATNSSEPVFDGNWLEPGQFIATIVNTDGVHQRTEADAATFVRADLIVLNSKQTAIANRQVELLDLIDQKRVGWNKVSDLSDALVGKATGRTTDQQIVYYKSNSGVGVQFAAAGAVIYEQCRSQGLGRELPNEWFGADLTEWLRKGYRPST
jgi:ornithine cyclodeaminase/alanine dehydrogenase-like protein (mu-crystallin family)